MMFASLLPETAVRLGADEVVLWQGRPDTRCLARRLFRVRTVGLYLAVLTVCNAAHLAFDRSASPTALTACLWVVLASLGVGAFLYAAAFCIARTTLYVITDKRLILHIGIALPIALTLPLRKIAAADLCLYPDGTGDIPITLDGSKLAYLLIWPHARPRRFTVPQPMLRAIPAAREVAAVLSEALLAVTPNEQVRTITTSVASARAGAVRTPASEAQPYGAIPVVS